MRNATLDTLVWVLVYGGLLLAGLGWYLRRGSDVLGVALLLAGLVLAAAGVLLLWLRSRRPPD